MSRWFLWYVILDLNYLDSIPAYRSIQIERRPTSSPVLVP